MSTVQAVNPLTNIEVNAKDVSLPRLRLEFLDGIRGLAALFIVFHHGFLALTKHTTQPLPANVLKTWGFLDYGHYAVTVFIVLSGFVLMLPVVRATDGQLQGGIFHYLKRRARRILPPYYAALVLSLAAIAFTPWRHCGNGWWDGALPAFSPGVIVSHILLLHNAWTNWIYKINGPFWSVATEWQIYFVFALCLLPLWRRFGMMVVILSSFAITLLPYVLLPHFYHFERASPWYLGLFALGMAGAELCASKSGSPSWYARVPWGCLTCLFFGVALAQTMLWQDISLWYVDPTFGVAATCFILYCHRLKTDGTAQPRLGVTRLLESAPAVWMGTFSYSLYLIHYPVLSLVHLFLKRNGFSAMTQFELLMTLGIALCICLAYGFHLVFERRFMSASPTSGKTRALRN